ncbi:Cytochrome P450 monooxygenase fpaps7 [Fusarium poae]
MRTLAVFTIGTGILLVVFICIYRLFFHPYAKYPGPFLAKLTSWYSVYHAYYGDIHIDIWECHNKYGNYVRYAPNRILVNTTEGLKEIYTQGKNTQKANAYRKVSLVPGVHPTFSMIDNQGHARLRRLVGQGLSNSHIRAYDSELRQSALLFATRLGEKLDRFEPHGSHVDHQGWTAPKNVASWSNYFTFDIMSHLVYGTSYELLTNSNDHWVIDGVLGQMRRISFLTLLPELEDMRFDRLLFPDARRKAYRFSIKSREIMEARKSKESSGGQEGRADLFSKLFAAKDPETGESLSDKQLWAESNLMIIAGSDTSSTGIAATFFYLSRNPSAYERVTNEVRSAITTAEDISQGPKLLSCTYLRACILESMRLSPPAGGVMWRQTIPGGLYIAGTDTEIHVPGGYEVGTGIYAIHHNEEYFPNPFEFRPERWLPEEVGDDAVLKAHAAFHTFSQGPRGCPGKSLAMLEIQFALAAVIINYDFRKVETQLSGIGEGTGKFTGQYQTFWAFTSLKDGPYIQFKRLGS